MKLSKAQKSVMDEMNNTLAVIDKYNTFEEFFDNSKNEQNTLTTAWNCNAAYNSSEKYEKQNPDKFNEMRKAFYRAKNERILLVFAKTETLNVLERYGLLEVVEHAKYKGGAERVKVK